jgi:23S rRNA pseudouridine1911/1915/1917 synthase
VTRQIHFRVSATEAGQRLDRVVVARVPGLGRRAVRVLCARGAIRVEGKRAAKGLLLSTDAEVTVEPGTSDQALPEPEAPLTVLLERPDLVVVEKPAGQPSAALPGRCQGSLASALLGRYPEMAEFGYGPREAGLVHRLDTETSGILVAARTGLAFEHLRQSLREKAWKKKYLAVVARPPSSASGVVEEPLIPDPHHRARMVAARSPGASTRARFARTHWQVLSVGSRYVLLELSVSLAIRHQIRAHLASLGCPIVGDLLYGGPPCPELGSRHALHASYVGWTGDNVVPGFEAEATLPPGVGVLISR